MPDAAHPPSAPTTDPDVAPPYFPPPPQGPQAIMRPLQWSTPWRWLAQGWRDLWTHPVHSSFYGLCFWAMAACLGWVFQTLPQYTMSIASGCLLIGPFLALGLYDISRRIEAGLPVSFGTSVMCWRPHMRSLGLLVLVLLVLELLWGRASLVVFAVFFNSGMPSTASVLSAIFNPDNYEFIAVYLAVGGVFAMLVYSTSVVSIPMILDRDTDAISATLVSMSVVFGTPAIMLMWAAMITGLVTLGLAPWGAGLVLVGPLLGHASWHAYRGAVAWTEDPQVNT